MSAGRPIRVLVCDDHRVLVEALVAALSSEPDILVAGTATSIAEVRRVLDVPVDVVLMDYLFGDGTGTEAVRLLKASQPDATVVMLTALADDQTILETIQAGADGYLTKDQGLDDVVAAVRAAYAHEVLLSRAVIAEIALRVADARGRVAERPVTEPLTPRELDVLRLLVEGLDSPTICEQLSVASNTLRTHVQNIMAKLGTHSKLATVAYALRHGLVAAPYPEGRLTAGSLSERPDVRPAAHPRASHGD